MSVRADGTLFESLKVESRWAKFLETYGESESRRYTRSTITARPSPPLMQRVATPRRSPRSARE